MDVVIAAAVNIAFSYALNTLFGSSQNYTQEGQRLDNLDVIGSQYGADIPWLFGQMRLSTNVIWGQPLREVVTTTTQSSGGKGGSGRSSVTSTNYSYFANFAVLIGLGVVRRPLRIWADKKLIWSAPDGATVLAGDFAGGGAFEFFTGTTTQGRSSTIQAVLGEATPAYRGRCYMVVSDYPMGSYSRPIPTIEVEVESEADPQVADIIMSMCQLAGLTHDQVDTSTIGTGIWGAKISSGTVSSTLENIMLGTGIQSVYDGTVLAFRPIEQPLTPDIPETDLLAGDDRFPIKRSREDDLPRRITLNHVDPARDYQAGSQQVTRHVTRSKQEQSLTTPVAISATQAHELCDALMYRAWTARVQYGPFGLPPKYMYLEPGDVAPITVDGRRHLVRIRKITIGANGALEVEGEAYDAAVLTGTPGSGSSGEFPGQTLPDYGTTTLRLFNAPPLTDTEAQQPGYRVAAVGTGRAWRAAVLEETIDAGATWTQTAVLPTYTVMGACNTTLAAPSEVVGDGNIDLTNTLQVTITRGELASVTDARLLAGDNLAMVGDEVIQFGHAELVGTSVYQLSRLLRGRKGSRYAMATHTAGEPFVLLSSSTFVPVPVSDIGLSKGYRVTPVGGTDIVTATFVADGRSVKPYSPVRIRGSRNDPYSDLTVTWVRRSRIGTELPNNADIPLDEPNEAYAVDILSGSTVVRSITTTVPMVTYTESQQIADFGAVQTVINVSICQLSNLVGRGYPATASL